jgi:hypothetical protein
MSRIYVAGDSTGKVERLVRANHPGHALKHVFRVRRASQDDLERLISRGVRVEDASATKDTPHEGDDGDTQA